MDDAEVQSRARSGEDSRTEFKRVDGGIGLDADAISKALVAFGNSGGGDLFLGIADDGSVVGVGGRAASGTPPAGTTRGRRKFFHRSCSVIVASSVPWSRS
jgi:predicted HTH transcriptional regulator